MPKAGSVILARVQFADTFEIKTRPAVVLFEEHNNIIIAGITSNTQMQGIPLTKKDGALTLSSYNPEIKLKRKNRFEHLLI